MGSVCNKCASYIEVDIADDIAVDRWLVLKRAKELDCPFFCESCYSNVMRWRAIRDICFVWPVPLPKTYIKGGNIERVGNEDNAEDELHGRTGYGILMAQGPGYWANTSRCCNARVLLKEVPTCDNCNLECMYEYRFHPTTPIEVGTIVIYDKFVPWVFFPKKPDGREEAVIICGSGDIKGVVKYYDGY